MVTIQLSEQTTMHAVPFMLHENRGTFSIWCCRSWKLALNRYKFLIRGWTFVMSLLSVAPKTISNTHLEVAMWVTMWSRPGSLLNVPFLTKKHYNNLLLFQLMERTPNQPFLTPDVPEMFLMTLETLYDFRSLHSSR